MGSGEVAIVALSTMISLKVTFSDGLGGQISLLISIVWATFTSLTGLSDERIWNSFLPPQAVRKRHFEAYHSWQSRYCDST